MVFGLTSIIEKTEIGNFVLNELMPDNCDIQNKVFEPKGNANKAKYEARENLHAGYNVWRTYFRTSLGDVRIKPNTDVERNNTQSITATLLNF